MKRTLMLATMAGLMLVWANAAQAQYVPPNTTGTYYSYGKFPAGSTAYKGGGDVDSYGDLVYVNRNGVYLDVYQITLYDTDGDSYLEPDQHPLNPEATGPMETRTLTYLKTYNVPYLHTATVGEIYATNDRVFFLAGRRIYQYVFATGVTSQVVYTNRNMSHLGYDPVNGVWYGSSEGARAVYKLSGSTWVHQFNYPNLAGSHMDGLEVVVDPSDSTVYVYVSDMTSDYLGQWHHNGTKWVNDNLFKYDGSAGYVEGMGFGALNHFWITTGFANYGTLYEIGGGKLAEYIPKCGNGKLDEGEECDDGNQTDGDGCTAQCTLENQPPVATCQDVVLVSAPDTCGGCATVNDVNNGSSDPDGDTLTFTLTPACPHALGATTVTLTVSDGKETDSCTATVTVLDQTPPAIECNGADIFPSDAPVSYTATATDSCSVASVTVTGYDCWAKTKKGKLIDKTGSCVVSFSGAGITVTDGGGVGTTIDWTVVAVDGSGNATTKNCSLNIKQPYNQGVGNGPEGGDPGNSNQGDPANSNDENGGTPGDPGKKGGKK